MCGFIKLFIEFSMLSKRLQFSGCFDSVSKIFRLFEGFSTKLKIRFLNYFFVSFLFRLRFLSVLSSDAHCHQKLVIFQAVLLADTSSNRFRNSSCFFFYFVE